MPYFLNLNESQAKEISISGGKGANLACLANTMPVPTALIISSELYNVFIKPLRASIESILKTPEYTNEQRSHAIQTLVLAQHFTNEIQTRLGQALQNAHLDQLRVAVRSSGTLEDLPGAAFAGQHDTILGVLGIEQITQAVIQCYASLWNAHVLPYRERLGVSHLEASMAVVIQMLVDVGSNEAAGVAFSVDPIRGTLDNILINAAFGLGETVVGGESPVDEYRIQRSDLSITEQHIAEKTQALISDPVAFQTKTVLLPTNKQQQASLTVEQCREVAKLALQAEAYFGFPQDIEWAFHQEQLYLLQSRPVTRIPTHWTRDESAERFPNPMTPLTWDLCEAGFHTSLNYSFRLMGLPPFHDKWFSMQDYYIYGNQNAVKLYSGRTPTAMLKDIESVRAALPQIAKQYAWMQELPIKWMRDLDTYLIHIGALMHESTVNKSITELWDYVLRINQLGTDYFLPNIAISLTQRTLYLGLQKLLSLGVPADQVHSIFDSLLAITDTKTGQVNNELWQLSRQIRQETALFTAFQHIESKTLLNKLASFPAFASAFELFLQRHGHRELDFDAYHPTWREAPHTVLDQLKILAQRPDYDREGEELDLKANQVATEWEVLRQTPQELRYFMYEVIRLARIYTALDDLEHYQTTRLSLPLRRGLRAIGDYFVQHHYLDKADDVYFIPLHVLQEAISQLSFSGLKAIAHHHRAGYNAAKQHAPEWIYGEKNNFEMDETGVLKGLGGSPGCIEGEVFLVHSPEDFASFPKNAILVARTTNPTWTPLFYLASGVITESGGPLSHGAVTARELGLPAVMAVRHALHLLKTGQRVQINGAQGWVKLL